MKADIQLSRAQQIWLILAVLAACIPVWYWLPWWAPVIGLLGLAWRSILLARGTARPGRWTMSLLGLVLMAAVLLTFVPPIGVEPMSAILTAGAGLKYLELERRRQSLLLIYLCYFIAAIQLVFEQTIVMFLITLFAFMLILSAQHVVLQDSRRHYSLRTLSWQPMGFAGRILLISIPLTLIIFFISPRVPSFWVVPIQSGAAETGVSDTMDPGSISSLGQSSEIAFRVAFEGDEIPPRTRLYWRGLVMSNFDGRTWRVANERRFVRDDAPVRWQDRRFTVDWEDQVERLGQSWEYEVFMEPSYQQYLFSLGAPQTEDRWVGKARDQTLLYFQPVSQRIRYAVASHLDYRLQPERLSADQLERNLYVPDNANPQARQMVRDWQAEGLQTREILGRVLQMYRDNFTYTFEPPTYPGANSIDTFLFEGQSGFCEHFASATAMILRAAGVPARVVGGYQGGELNPYENYLVIRQYDAHAWVEYWQEGRGWVSVDPTAAVAAGRIDRGFQDYFDYLLNGQGNLFSLNNLRNTPLLTWVRLQFDSVNYLWVRWIVSYDSGDQIDLFSGILGGYSPSRIAIFLSFLFVAPLAIWWAYTKYVMPARLLSRRSKMLIELRSKLERAGVQVSPATTLDQIAAQAVERLPGQAVDLRMLLHRIQLLLYSEQGSMAEIERDVRLLQLPRSINPTA